MTDHAIIRAKERYGIELTVEDGKRIIDYIKFRDPRCLYTKGNTYAIFIKGIWVAACVSKNLYYDELSITTFLRSDTLPTEDLRRRQSNPVFARYFQKYSDNRFTNFCPMSRKISRG